MSVLSFAELVKLSGESGLAVIGASVAAPHPNAARHLQTWQEEGFAGEMKYMKRDPHKLTNPQQLLPEARSVIQFAVHYGSLPTPARTAGFGRVARYAWGLDYHDVLRARLKVLIEKLQSYLGGDIKARPFSDAVPFTERAFGERAGLGFIGKNTLLIRPGQGSFFFLADIITDLEISGIPTTLTKGRCGDCTNCLDSCPTGAFVAPYRLDARRCISYLTIEKRGVLTSEEESWVGEWIFGCDICQEVCPFNHGPLKLGKKPDLEMFNKDAGAGPVLDLRDILGIRSEDAFEKRFQRTPLTRTGREGLLRNAAIVAGNTLWLEGIDSLLEVLLGESSTVVQIASVNALAKISRASGTQTRKSVEGRLHSIRGSAAPEVQMAIFNFLEH